MQCRNKFVRGINDLRESMVKWVSESVQDENLRGSIPTLPLLISTKSPDRQRQTTRPASRLEDPEENMVRQW